MAGKSSIDKFLDAVANESVNTQPERTTGNMCDKAMKEIEQLENIRGSGKRTLGELKQLIQRVLNKEYPAAKRKVKAIQKELKEIQNDKKEVADLPDSKPEKRTVPKVGTKTKKELNKPVPTVSTSSTRGTKPETHQVTDQSSHETPSKSQDTHQVTDQSSHETPSMSQDTHQVTDQSSHETPSMSQDTHQVTDQSSHVAPLMSQDTHQVTDQSSHETPSMSQDTHQVTDQSSHVTPSKSQDTTDKATNSGREEMLKHQQSQPDVNSQCMSRTIEEDIEYRSKRASKALRQNNPNIADLSDGNRPTKVAENFSELYDNEWTDAFEEVNNKPVVERKVIQLLLTIVQKSYEFCRQKATKQIEEIATMFESILLHGPDEYLTKECPPKRAERADDGLLVQFRKGIAGEALQELTTGFFKSVLYDMCGESKLPRKPKENGPLEKYAKKVVELTWWMCVQDPPVYMCPPTIDGFNASIYRAYTKSGHEPDFFVWPALRLHKDGGILLKGVVQFK